MNFHRCTVAPLIACLALVGGCASQNRTPQRSTGDAAVANGEAITEVSTLDALVGAHVAAGARADTRAEINRVIDSWHRAAATGDLDEYAARMTAGAVFLGTEEPERWVGREFIEFAEPYFDGPTAYGEGAWTYEPRERWVTVSGDTAWFDERLTHDRYGKCRGTGVLVLGDDGAWRIAHYSLSFPVPNAVAGEVIEIIRAHDGVPDGQSP